MSVRRRLGFAGLLLVGAGLAAACGTSSDPVVEAELSANCTLDSDCTSPLVCAFQSCHIQCETSADCRAENLGLCIESDRPYKVCQNPKEETCTRNSDCAGTEVCAVDDRCRDACLTSKDCITGQQCTTGVCADLADLVDGGLVQSDASADAAGQHCIHSSDCPGALICSNGVCNVECTADKDCPVTFTCEETRCVPPGYELSDGAVIKLSPDASDHDGASKDAAPDAPSDAAPSCAPPRTSCSASCVDTNTDANHCGECATACALANVATEACTGGSCAVGTCSSGFADCDAVAANGCEVDARSDDANCGGCGVMCASGCRDAQCPVEDRLVRGLIMPNAIAVDSSNVYWSDFGTSASTGDGSIACVPIGGALDPTVLASSQFGPTGIGIDANNVYWPTAAAGGRGAVWGVPIAGGDVEQLGAAAANLTLTVYDTNVYFTTYGGKSRGIYRFPTDESAKPALLTTSVQEPAGVAADSTNVYWTDASAGTVNAVSIADGTIVTLATGQVSPASIVVDATNVYWSTLGDKGTPGTVMASPIAGGAATTLVSGASTIGGIAVDDTSLYWTDSGAVTVSKVPLAGGTPVVLSTDGDQPDAIAVDATSVYWTDSSDGVVYKLTPK